ncbi:MAG: CHC2 zinc finger domain-containing protein [Bdellovibrionales bacterium]
MLKGHRTAVISLSFSPDGRRLLSASSEEIRIWNPNTGGEIRALKDLRGQVIAFNPDATKVVIVRQLPQHRWHFLFFEWRSRRLFTLHRALGNPHVTETPAIDFAVDRATVTLAAVLALLGSTLGASQCFSANVEQNVFHCFKCGRSGNALDLWASAKERSIYDAAVDLCQRLAIPLPLLGNREVEPVASSNQSSTMDKSESLGSP